MLKQQRRAVRSVMDMSLFVMLLLSGLLCSASGFQREYHYINTMLWSEAQSYCRARFTDLATVDSMDDVNRMINTVNDGYSGSVWIGLKRPTPHGWVWSMRNEALTQYSPWQGSQPSGSGDCVCSVGTYWYDISCAGDYDFVCYDETTGYILITERKNWRDAQSYCRQYHTDLLTIHNSVEQDLIVLLSGASRWVWIGLSSDFSWHWSDQGSLSFINWAERQPSTSGGDCVAMSTIDSGKWIQNSCDLQHPFICYEEAQLVKKLANCQILFYS